MSAYSNLDDASTEPRTLPAPGAPMEVAHELVAERYTGPDRALRLRHWRGGWWEWQGPRWVEIEQRAVRATAYTFTETAVYEDGDKLKPWAPNRHKRSPICSTRSPRSFTWPRACQCRHGSTEPPTADWSSPLRMVA